MLAEIYIYALIMQMSFELREEWNKHLEIFIDGYIPIKNDPVESVRYFSANQWEFNKECKTKPRFINGGYVAFRKGKIDMFVGLLELGDHITLDAVEFGVKGRVINTFILNDANE